MSYGKDFYNSNSLSGEQIVWPPFSEQIVLLLLIVRRANCGADNNNGPFIIYQMKSNLFDQVPRTYCFLHWKIFLTYNRLILFGQVRSVNIRTSISSFDERIWSKANFIKRAKISALDSAYIGAWYSTEWNRNYGTKYK